MRRKLELLKKEEPSLLQELATTKVMLRDLRATLLEVEAEVRSVDERLQLEAQSRRRQADEELSQWEEKVINATEHLQALRSHSRHDQAVQVAQSSHQVSREALTLHCHFVCFCPPVLARTRNKDIHTLNSFISLFVKRIFDAVRLLG